jgi:hypothetical protein
VSNFTVLPTLHLLEHTFLLQPLDQLDLGQAAALHYRHDHVVEQGYPFTLYQFRYIVATRVVEQMPILYSYISLHISKLHMISLRYDVYTTTVLGLL